VIWYFSDDMVTVPSHSNKHKTRRHSILIFPHHWQTKMLGSLIMRRIK
jgi:hypothetical protein